MMIGAAMRILVVEDEPRAAQMLAKGLREEAYAVDVVGDGERALYQLAITEYDAIILDVILPLQDGLAVCRELRKSSSTVPVLMLTARDAVDAPAATYDLVCCFEALHDLPRPVEALQAMRAMLAPGGVVGVIRGLRVAIEGVLHSDSRHEPPAGAADRVM